MIKGITTELSNKIMVKRPSLRNPGAKLKPLYGSSMSGMHGPNFVPTEMIIPGGLNGKEKLYYFFNGKLPKTVYERWVPAGTDYTPQSGDQTVTVNIGDHVYVGNIIEPPKDVLSGDTLECATTNMDASSIDLLDDGLPFDDQIDGGIYDGFSPFGGVLSS